MLNFLFPNLRLACSLCAAVSLLITFAQANSYQGHYSGTHNGSSIGEFFAIVRSDYSLTVWSYDATWDESFENDLTLSSNATFSGIVGDTLVTGAVSLAGNISGTGTGQFGNISFSGSRISQTGSTANSFGTYEGTATTSLGTGTLSAVISGDGTIWIYTESIFYENGGRGNINSNGTFTIVDSGLLTFNGSVNQSTQEVSGTVATTGDGQAIGTFSLSPISIGDSTGGNHDEPNDTPETANLITNGETQTHSIHEIGDIDWATFTITVPYANVTVETANSGPYTYIYLYAAADTTNELSKDFLGGELGVSTLSEPLPAGTYYVKVEELGNDETIAAYDLTVSWTETSIPTPDSYESDDTPETATTISNGETQTHSTHDADDEDWVKFTIEDGAQNIHIETSGDAGDTHIFLYGPNQSRNGLWNNDYSGEGKFSLLDADDANLSMLPPGTYWLSVQSENPIPHYDLSIIWTEVDPSIEGYPGDAYEWDDSASQAKTISNGETQNKSVHTAGYDWVKFTISEDVTDLRVVASPADDYFSLTLYRGGEDLSYMKSVRENETDGSIMLSSEKDNLPTLTPGTYYIQLTAIVAVENYALSISWTDNSASPYQTWANDRLSSFSSDDKQTLADPDSDLLTNLMEYAIGTDPTSGLVDLSGLTIRPSIDNSQTELTLILRSGDDQLHYTLRLSSNMSAWTNYELSFSNDGWSISGQTLNIENTEDLGDSLWKINISVPAETTFARLKVGQQ